MSARGKVQFHGNGSSERRKGGRREGVVVTVIKTEIPLYHKMKIPTENGKSIACLIDGLIYSSDLD